MSRKVIVAYRVCSYIPHRLETYKESYYKDLDSALKTKEQLTKDLDPEYKVEIQTIEKNVFKTDCDID